MGDAKICRLETFLLGIDHLPQRSHLLPFHHNSSDNPWRLPPAKQALALRARFRWYDEQKWFRNRKAKFLYACDKCGELVKYFFIEIPTFCPPTNFCCSGAIDGSRHRRSAGTLGGFG